jgi:hypothetical protein
MAGASEGDLARLFAQAGLGAAEAATLAIRVRHATFEEWWEPFTLGVGPAGAHVASLTPGDAAALRERCRELLAGPGGAAGPVEISAIALAATCTV